MSEKTVTCSFVLDKDIYNAFKSVVSSNGENVKGCLVRFMKSVATYNTTNPTTIMAIEEVKELKKNPNKKVYASFSDIIKEIDKDDE